MEIFCGVLMHNPELRESGSVRNLDGMNEYEQIVDGTSEEINEELLSEEWLTGLPSNHSCYNP